MIVVMTTNKVHEDLTMGELLMDIYLDAASRLRSLLSDYIETLQPCDIATASPQRF